MAEVKRVRVQGHGWRGGLKAGSPILSDKEKLSFRERRVTREAAGWDPRQTGEKTGPCEKSTYSGWHQPRRFIYEAHHPDPMQQKSLYPLYSSVHGAQRGELKHPGTSHLVVADLGTESKPFGP